MSSIASFYLLEKDLSEALLQAVVPQRKVIEKKVLFFTRKLEQTVDNFWNFLKEHATEQESFGYSGTGFTDLEPLLEEKGINLYQFGSGELAQKLAAARPAIVAVFDQAAAMNTLKLLNETVLSQDEARQYSLENFPNEDEVLVAESILAARDIFESWLGAVKTSKIGLLIIG